MEGTRVEMEKHGEKGIFIGVGGPLEFGEGKEWVGLMLAIVPPSSFLLISLWGQSPCQVLILTLSVLVLFPTFFPLL